MAKNNFFKCKSSFSCTPATVSFEGRGCCQWLPPLFPFTSTWRRRRNMKIGPEIMKIGPEIHRRDWIWPHVAGSKEEVTRWSLIMEENQFGWQEQIINGGGLWLCPCLGEAGHIRHAAAQRQAAVGVVGGRSKWFDADAPPACKLWLVVQAEISR